MSKKPKGTNGGQAAEPSKPRGSETGQPAGTAQQQAPQLSILAQFVRDISFESPNAPKTLQNPGKNPKLDLNINVQSVKRGDDLYECALNFDAKAASEDGVIYNIEIVYCGLFRIANVPEAMMQGVLFVDCPTLLFPFMRRVVAQLAQDGGYPPLMLDPIDFAALYRRNAQAAAQSASQPKT